MNLQIKQSNPRLFAIQGLRAYAAGFVTFVHALATYDEKILPYISPEIFQGLGELGVKLFFCISGFIIYKSANNYDKSLINAWYFFRRRIIRVAPIYWVATLIYALKLTAQGMPPSVIDLFKSFLFIPYPNSAGLMRPVLGQGWTLNYEMLFYLLFSISILTFSRFRVIFLTVLLITFYAVNLLFPVDFYSGYFYSCFYLLTEHYLLYFLIGLFVSVFIEAASRKEHHFELDYRVSILLASIFLVMFFIVTRYWALSGVLLEISVVFCCTGCLFVCAIEHSCKIDLDHKLSLVLQTAGDASYSTYLTHGFVMGFAARFISALKFDIKPLVFAGFMVIACTIFGIIFYKVVEKPLLSKLNSYFR